ncbi:PrpF domain-containing protein [Bordetella muralis]|uniref:PrpF domain-containing protein n=1 Tax=Bordetella muralis TaxID=1649130 RepID=UPI0039EF98C0
MTTDPILLLDRPRLQAASGIVEFPVHHMRGGTSTGLVIWEAFAPKDEALREELLKHLMGVPLSGSLAANRQITGLGRGPATSNKVFFVSLERANGRQRLVSTLAQLAATHSRIDWSVNCGNMSSALPLWLLDSGLVALADVDDELEIRNTNTGVISTGRLLRDERGALVHNEIPGVYGQYPSVDLFLHDPVGSKTGKLLPTGSPVDVIDGIPVSCVDVAVPMVIIKASDLGKTAHESIDELESDPAFMTRLRHVWIQAGMLMQLRRRDGTLMSETDIATSETIPKVCIVGSATNGGTLSTRYFTPQTGHASMAVSGGCCLAAACLIKGSVAADVATGLPTVADQTCNVVVSIENPAGTLDATVVARRDGKTLKISKVAYRRSAQVLLKGHVPLYRATNALSDALLQPTACQT